MKSKKDKPHKFRKSKAFPKSCDVCNYTEESAIHWSIKIPEPELPEKFKIDRYVSGTDSILKEKYKHKYATIMVKPNTLKKLKQYADYRNMTMINMLEDFANDMEELIKDKLT